MSDLNSYWKVSLGEISGGPLASLMEENSNYFLNQLTQKARRRVPAASIHAHSHVGGSYP